MLLVIHYYILETIIMPAEKRGNGGEKRKKREYGVIRDENFQK
jgi:hypothetical protein